MTFRSARSIRIQKSVIALVALAALTCGVEAAEGQPALAASQRFQPQLEAISSLLFPADGEGYVVRFEGKIVGEGHVLTKTKWLPGGPGGLAVSNFRDLLGGEFARTGTGWARGQPERLAELYAPKVQEFAGRPDKVFTTAFGVVPPADERLVVVERPDCIVVASHNRGRISRMAVVMSAGGLDRLYGESEQLDRIHVRNQDCKARAEISALGGWGIFFEPGAMLLTTGSDPFGDSRAEANFKTGIFQSEVISLLPEIRAGLTSAEFRTLTGLER